MSETIRVRSAGPASEVAQPAQPTPPPPPPPPPPAAPARTDGAIVDSKGRVLTLRGELTFLQDMDLAELAGARSSNELWMMNFLVSMRIGAIDGNPVPLPKNEVQLRSTLQLIGKEGVNALIAHFTPEVDEDGLPLDTGSKANTDAGEQAKN